jgi:large conductance mechanosensitive channel
VAESWLAQMKKFLVETNAMSLALGVVIGGAVGKLVTSLVDGLIMPLVSVVLPGGEWRDWKVVLQHGAAGADGKMVGEKALLLGQVLGATLDFLIIAFVVFVVASKLLKTEVKK